MKKTFALVFQDSAWNVGPDELRIRQGPKQRVHCGHFRWMSMYVPSSMKRPREDEQPGPIRKSQPVLGRGITMNLHWTTSQHRLYQDHFCFRRSRRRDVELERRYIQCMRWGIHSLIIESTYPGQWDTCLTVVSQKLVFLILTPYWGNRRWLSVVYSNSEVGWDFWPCTFWAKIWQRDRASSTRNWSIG